MIRLLTSQRTIICLYNNNRNSYINNCQIRRTRIKFRSNLVVTKKSNLRHNSQVTTKLKVKTSNNKKNGEKHNLHKDHLQGW